jgi:adenylate kinase family enzyme
MDRVVVVGPPGSGKTTTAAVIAQRLDAPHTELDSLWWDPNWTEAGRDTFRARLAPVVAADRWVVDGNYTSAGAADLVWPRADVVVWLDLGRWVTVPRVVRRTFTRAALRRELWNGNRESVRLALRADSIIWYAYREHPKYNRKYDALAREGDHPNWVRLQTPRAVRRWVAGIPPR